MHTINRNEISSFQNRVDPLGNLIHTKARGAWMGNRGHIHNDKQQIVRSYKLPAWLICQLHFKNRQRQIMSPNTYTELFFLDEATAFAAGHRPCFECRREDHLRFKTAWITGNKSYGFTEKTSIQEIDKILQKERITKEGTKVTYEAVTEELPNGVFILFNDAPHLIYDGQIYAWTPFGYELPQPLPQKEKVPVLKPKSTVQTFCAGYIPQIHRSVNRQS